MWNVVVTVVVLGTIGACVLVFSAAEADRPSVRSVLAAPPQPPGADPDAVAERLFYRGEYEQAAEAYRALVAKDPLNSLAWARLAHATHELGRFEAALELHRQAARFPDNRLVSLFKLGCALARLGRPEEAIAALERAVEAGYGDRSRAEHEEDLEALRGHERFAIVLDRMAPPPPGAGPLNFWAGHWSARDPKTGEITGHSTISLVEDGHLFQEHWSDLRLSSGRGIAYLDPADGLWKMVRVDSRGEVQRLEGRFRDGALHLSGDRIHYGGRVIPLSAVLELRPDGWVHLTMRQSEDGGTTWSPLLDRFLVREEPMYYGRGRYGPGGPH